MHPLYLTEFQKERQAELTDAADAWRLSHGPSTHSFRHRAGSRLIALGHRLLRDGATGGGP